jgi:hypothetical protein
LVITLIARNSIFELADPIVGVTFWSIGKSTVFMSMPKTTIHEDGDFTTRVGNIGFTRSLLPMQAITRKTSFSQKSAYNQLRSGVLSCVGLHGFTYGQTAGMVGFGYCL